MVQGPGPKRADRLVEMLADPGDLEHADPRIGAERDCQVVHAPGRGAVDAGLHHDRVERPVDLAPPGGLRIGMNAGALEQLWECAARRRPALVASSLGRLAVAFGDAVIGALVAHRDHPGGYEVDEFLERGADRLADHVGDIAGAERLEKLRQDRLGQGHRWLSISA